ncbi:MAG: hypothetical protein AOA66_0314 [Candidatus Bathyarchaeota archaeon BA2]|nr:MAG: hypothetical protein AOA66_0314 [Candidatus Bathyarchaeota archaeon BA2]
MSQKVKVLSQEVIRLVDNQFEELLVKSKGLIAESRIVWRWDNEDVIVAYHPLVGSITFLNPTMAELFSLTLKEASTDLLMKYMQDTYPNVNKQVIKKDLIQALKFLFVNGFIKLKFSDKDVAIYEVEEYVKVNAS